MQLIEMRCLELKEVSPRKFMDQLQRESGEGLRARQSAG
jgi:hypothetical protein